MPRTKNQFLRALRLCVRQLGAAPFFPKSSNVKLNSTFPTRRKSELFFKLLYNLVIPVILLSVALDSSAQEMTSSPEPTSTPKPKRSLERAIDEAWKTTWSRFYHPDTQLFYDYITSYQSRKSLAHLPRPEEVARQFPNGHGYDTGMEDCMISAGVMLVMVVDRHAVTGDKKLSARAKAIFDGIRRAATVHGSPGFIARGISVEDAQSTYPGTSRDQVTHVVHGLWYYYNSPLCNDETKEEVRALLTAIADRMKRNVIPENNYDFLRSDNSCEPIGLQRMWNVGGHEAARLPMIYAAAWNATANDDYYHLYRKYIYEAIQQSQMSVSHVSTWGLLQMQASFELLGSMEKDSALQPAIAQMMRDIAVECRRRAKNAWNDGCNLDLTTVANDWRLPNGGIKSNGQYRKVWYCIRQSGESALAQIIAGPAEFPDEQRRMLKGAIQRLDYNQVSSNGIYYLQAAYWKGRKMKIY